MKKNILIIVLSIALIISISINVCNYFDSMIKITSNYESLLAVLSNPDAYNGKNMFVEGVLSISDDGVALYLSKEHKEHNAKKNAIYIDFEFSDAEYEDLLTLEGDYVDIKGRLNLTENGPTGCYSGVMESIEKCKPNGAVWGPTVERDDGTIVLTD